MSSKFGKVCAVNMITKKGEFVAQHVAVAETRKATDPSSDTVWLLQIDFSVYTGTCQLFVGQDVFLEDLSDGRTRVTFYRDGYEVLKFYAQFR